MAVFYDSLTSFYIGDSLTIPLAHSLPTATEIQNAFSPMILSASGWRKIFTSSGDEEDFSADIGDANRVLSAHIANVFADYLLTKSESAKKKEIVFALDSRPTGTEIADVMCRVFIARGFSVRFLFIASAPEIMAYAREVGAFAYISASHNPVGHNGVKFGLSDGGVLSGTEIAPLISSFKEACISINAAEKARQLIALCNSEKLEAVWNSIACEKAKALDSYERFSREVISGETDTAKQDAFFEILSNATAQQRLKGKSVSIMADFNGSARCCSIDRHFLENTGVALLGMNEKPRMISHRIVPEGDSLLFCAREIERLHIKGKTSEERNILLGYVPDCDGDRGNIVFWNEHKKKAETLEAQEVFALSVIAELSHLVYLEHIHCESGKPAEPPVAISINDPTSLRIEAISSFFGSHVARAEVGEANVVNLARSLRNDGYIVRILGEGSNGGNITHPAAVRDPLNTVYALLKMLIIRDDGAKKGLFHIWCSLSGQEDAYKTDFTLSDIMTTLPPFVTTSVFEKDAMLKIHTTDHALLKKNFQKVFEKQWMQRASELHSLYGFETWTAVSNNGTKQTNDLTDFSSSGKGGLTVQFMDKNKKPAAFIWMRGSGTEPVFRILADARGKDVAVERMLLSWLTAMVLEADSKIE